MEKFRRQYWSYNIRQNWKMIAVLAGLFGIAIAVLVPLRTGPPVDGYVEGFRLVETDWAGSVPMALVRISGTGETVAVEIGPECKVGAPVTLHPQKSLLASRYVSDGCR